MFAWAPSHALYYWCSFSLIAVVVGTGAPSLCVAAERRLEIAQVERKLLEKLRSWPRRQGQSHRGFGRASYQVPDRPGLVVVVVAVVDAEERQRP